MRIGSAACAETESSFPHKKGFTLSILKGTLGCVQMLSHDFQRVSQASETRQPLKRRAKVAFSSHRKREEIERQRGRRRNSARPAERFHHESPKDMLKATHSAHR